MPFSKNHGGHSPQGALVLVLVGVVAAAAYAATEAAVKYQVVRDTQRFTRIAPAALQMIERGEAAFLQRDAAAVGATLADDYSWWIVSDKGPSLAMQGRDNTVKLLGGFFGKQQWFESKVYRLGMAGNMLVQIEVDKVGSPAGPVEKTSLEIYEFRNGLRWREWRFTPGDKPL